MLWKKIVCIYKSIKERKSIENSIWPKWQDKQKELPELSIIILIGYGFVYHYLFMTWESRMRQIHWYLHKHRKINIYSRIGLRVNSSLSSSDSTMAALRLLLPLHSARTAWSDQLRTASRRFASYSSLLSFLFLRCRRARDARNGRCVGVGRHIVFRGRAREHLLLLLV